MPKSDAAVIPGDTLPQVDRTPPPQQLGDASAEVTAIDGDTSPQRSGVKFGFLSLDSLHHYLRLRKGFRVTDRLSSELGLDYDVSRRVTIPSAFLSYELVRKDKRLATLVFTPSMVKIRKSFHVAPPKVSCDLHAAAGLTYDGTPEFGVDVDNIKPAAIVAAAAVGLILMGKPLSGNRDIGSFFFGIPRSETTGVAKGEVKATIQRRGKGLQLGLKQLNAIIRL